MSKQYWFKRKKYGFGWTPATWQGWLAVGLYLAFFVGYFIWKDQFGVFPNQILADAVPLVVATLLLVAISYWKGEPPRWQWGDEK